MSCTTTADLSLIPDIEAFEERVAIMVYDGGIPSDQAKELAAQAQGLRRKEKAGLDEQFAPCLFLRCGAENTCNLQQKRLIFGQEDRLCCTQ